MTAYDYLLYMGTISGIDRKTCAKKIPELLKWMELEKFGGKKIRGFSAGMRQRLSLLQAMIHDPELLILDEPTANLDPEGRFTVIQKITELCRKKGITVLISSHILSELEKCVDYVTILNHGQIVVESEIKSLEQKFKGKKYLLKTSENKNILKLLKSKKFVSDAWTDDEDRIHIIAKGDDREFKKQITRVILESDAYLEEFKLETSDLESIFMEVVGKEKRQEAAAGEGKRERLGFLRRFKGGEK